MKRVVITGIGVVAPNGVGADAFLQSLKSGISGIRFDEQLAELGFSCKISGTPEISEEIINANFSELELKNLNASGIIYGVIAGMEAWQDAGLGISPSESPDWRSGAIFGTGTSGVGKFRESIYRIDEKQTRKLGSTAVSQTMASGISAWLGGKIGLGNQVTTNSSACTTGTESILMAYDRIRAGKAVRILAGSTADTGPYIWGGFDAMRVCTFKHNESPEKGSRPLSASASGFVPAGGAGGVVVEELESALERGAKIYCEILGGHINSGGQRGPGSMTAPNHQAVQRCIREAVADAGIHPSEIDMINGHLTATSKDAAEISNWSIALERNGADFPYVSATKSAIGHCLSGAGSIECVAAILQLREKFVAPNLNCEDLHPEISSLVDPRKIPQELINSDLQIVAKASFGFGDVNACIIFKQYNE